MLGNKNYKYGKSEGNEPSTLFPSKLNKRSCFQLICRLLFVFHAEEFNRFMNK